MLTNFTPRDFDEWIGAIFFLFLSLVLFAFLLAGCEWAGLSTRSYGLAEVMGGGFTPGETTTGVGIAPGMGQDGGSGVIVVSSTKSEKWDLILRDTLSGEVFTKEVRPEVFYSVEVGDIVRYSEVTGNISKIRYSVRIEE